MKRYLFLLLLPLSIELNAQCPITINGSNTSICSGTCITFTATGAQTYTWIPGGGNTSTITDCPGVTTTYTVIGSSNGGTCTDSATVTVNVIANPTITATASQNPICAGSTFTLVASGAISYSWSPGIGLNCTTCNPATGSITSATMYTVCGTNGNGCLSCATIGVQVVPAPSVSFTMSPSGTPQVWDAVPNYSGGSGSYTYDWDWGDGSAHATTAYPSHTYSVAAYYNICCKITDAFGCTASTCQNDSLYRTNATMITVNVVSGSSATAPVKTERTILYPNPATNEITIETPTPCLIHIFDLTGRKVLSQNSNGKTQLDIRSLNEGLYTLSIKYEDRIITRKMTIVR